jgi:hypothetical protein
MDDRRWDFKRRIYVRVHRELILLAKRAMHVPGDDGFQTYTW